MHNAVTAVHDELGAGAPHVIFTVGWVGVVRAGLRRRGRRCFGLGDREDYHSVVVLVVVAAQPPPDAPAAPACAAARLREANGQLMRL